jgi:hypothetical protein
MTDTAWPAGFVDEQHDVDEVLSRDDVGEVVWLSRSRRSSSTGSHT